MTPSRITYAQLRAAAPSDPAAFRAFWKIMGMICLPEEVYTDPRVVACTQEVLNRRGHQPPMAQPSRETAAHRPRNDLMVTEAQKVTNALSPTR